VAPTAAVYVPEWKGVTHSRVTRRVASHDHAAQQGTYTNGQRYGKNEAVTTDTALAMLSRDCQLGEVKVRFFGDSIAIVYGAESRIRKDKDGKEARRCQVWTDTWLRRDGRWQIVAAQDTVIPCPQ